MSLVPINSSLSNSLWHRSGAVSGGIGTFSIRRIAVCCSEVVPVLGNVPRMASGSMDIPSMVG